MPLPPVRAGGTESRSCLLERQEVLSTPRVLAAVLGAFLFWNAGVLSESTPFRWAPRSASGPVAGVPPACRLPSLPPP